MYLMRRVEQHFDIEGHVILVNGLIHTYIHTHTLYTYTGRERVRVRVRVRVREGEIMIYRV